MTTNPNVSPAPLARILSLACYLGLAPMIRLWRSRSSDPFFRHHYLQSMAAFFLALLWLCAIFLFETGVTIIQVRFPELGWRLHAWEFYLIFIMLALLVLFWVALVGLALAGSSRQMPLLKRLTHSAWVIRLSLISNAMVLVIVPIVAAVAVYATSLTSTNREGSAVYFLYDEGAGVPRWVFALGMSRVILQAQRNWGTGCTVLDRLNAETLRTALASGKVVILATHGEQGYAVTYYAPECLYVGPPDTGAVDEMKNTRFLRTTILGRDHKWSTWKNAAVGDGLRLVYVFACNSGTRAAQWQEHLAPAQVITYNRVSTIFDHALWFAFTGPADIRRIKQ